MPDKVRPYMVTKHEDTNIGRFRIIYDLLNIKGKEYPYSYIIGGDFVVILPIYKGKVIFINQYRHALNRWFNEIPAGGINKGETPEQAAVRELQEEAGLSGRLIKLCELPGAQGTSSEMAHIYAAICDRKVESETEPTEFIKVQEETEAGFDDMIMAGKFHQLAGIVAWYFYKNQKNRVQ